MSDTVIIAIVAMIGALLSGPLAAMLTSYLANRQRHTDKIEDWRRQDEVANRVAEATLNYLVRMR